VIVCEVLGTVVATQKDPGLRGVKLLLVQRRNTDGSLSGEVFVATDTVGAGTGEVVLVVTGASARATALTKEAPTDATIVGIVDSVEAEEGAAGRRRLAIDAHSGRS
jgi:microcompartment protein CcmK/EutM